MDFKQDWKYLFTSFDGRINRAPFWAGVLVLIAVNIVASILASIIHVQALSVIVSLVLIYPSVALYAKRWHDRSKSGWWTLILLVPLLGIIYAIYEIGTQPGTPGSNQYGPNPLGA
ncbi:DUF805 domain-containing protein [Devosia sp.]|uniref:DUF805 domain-containing protein n=1 Tax=Devosia sp. TaxID=1871048 RepID=UPI0032679713